jgi:RNA polymerase sigma-B factor
VSEPRADYTCVTARLRQLRDLEPGSREYQRLRAAVIEQTLPLADNVARRFRGRGQSHEDLFQVASIGLVNAVNRFDPDNGADFLAFAVPTIMGEVRRHFRDTGWAVKVPRRLKELHVDMARARAELTHQSGRAPSAGEIAAHLGIDREEVVQATIAGSNYATLSTDQTFASDGNVMTLKDTIGEPDSRLDKVVDVETVRPLIENLPSREQAVLKMRFFDDMTQTQIAERLGYSQMHVSRLLAKSLTLLRSQALDPHPGGRRRLPRSGVERRRKTPAA